MYKLTTKSILTLDGLQLTEHNRSELSVDHEVINRSQRTVEGHMRRQHVAVKRSFSVSWTDLPHTAAYTVDSKLGAQQMITSFTSRMDQPLSLVVARHGSATQTYTVLIDSFDYSVSKRRSYELWNVSLTLIEV